MSLKDFREQLLEQLLRFLWRQWSTLGVLGEAGTGDDWAIDPEALLFFSLQITRYEPRQFDEILAWLVENGRWLDVSRLRHIAASGSESQRRVLGGALHWTAVQAKIQKWDNFIRFLEKDVDQRSELKAAEARAAYPTKNRSSAAPTLFLMRNGEDYPAIASGTEDESFRSFGFVRSKLKNLKSSRPVPVNAKTNVRFLLRSLFGVGSRAEILLYLLTHEGGHPRDVADSIGLFWLGVQQTLSAMADSGLILKTSKGKRVEYRVSHKKWWDFLSFSGEDVGARPKWLNWMVIFSALWKIWKNLDELAQTDMSDYLKSSKLLDSLETLHHEFSRAGFDVPPVPSMAIPSDLHQATTMQFLNKVLR